MLYIVRTLSVHVFYRGFALKILKIRAIIYWVGRNSFSVFVLNDRNKIYWRVNFGYICCRGSQETRGSKLWVISTISEAEGRGSQEPRGSKSFVHGYIIILFVEARKSLVDRNLTTIASSFCVSVEARKSLVDRNQIGTFLHQSWPGRGSQEPRGSKLQPWCIPRSLR